MSVPRCDFRLVELVQLQRGLLSVASTYASLDEWYARNVLLSLEVAAGP